MVVRAFCDRRERRRFAASAGAGTRARVLSRYVRDQKSLSLLAAIAKMSLMPAQRLQQLTPVAERLGRIQEGARADIAVFDPATVQDRATFRAAAEPSVGMRYVMGPAL